MKQFIISIPYIYPACPLNIDHARLFILGDIVARYKRSIGKKVIFPIATHYSGVASFKIANQFKRIFDNEATTKDDNLREIYNLYNKNYEVPEYIMQKFVDPLFILDYFSQENLWELNSMNVSCDYDNYYSTNIKDFSIFISVLFKKYKELGALVKNSKNELALNYNNTKWTNNALFQIKNSTFIQEFTKENIISAMKNVKDEWGILRNDGLGVPYKKGLIIDPMFDSEIFPIFDLYVKYVRKFNLKLLDKKVFFNKLFNSIQSGINPNNNLSKAIIMNLPCDLLICEEHLKNWIAKKIYTENLLFAKKYRTKHFLITGMGLLDGKRMSASKGHAILTKDYIKQYGGTVARLSVLLCGGHPSKMYSYDKNIPIIANKFINEFLDYYRYLFVKSKNIKNKNLAESPLFIALSKRIEENINKFYFKQAIIELIAIIPKKYKSISGNQALALISLYDKYLEMFLPDLYKNIKGYVRL